MSPSSAATVALELIRHEAQLESAVLVLRGTGLNIWHYYQLLRALGVERLRRFHRVYCVSGSAVCLWMVVMERAAQLIPNVAVQYDPLMRDVMNRYSLVKRMSALAGNRPVYSTRDNADLLEQFVLSAESRGQQLQHFALPNVVLVGVDELTQSVLMLDATTHGCIRTIDALVNIVTSSTIRGRAYCERKPLEGRLIGDLDTASAPARREFRAYLRHRYEGRPQLIVNLYKSSVHGRTTYLRSCRAFSPGLFQALDATLLFAGIPNRRYAATARSDESGLATVMST